MNNETTKGWEIKQELFAPEKRGFYESIFSLGNGYMGVRGFHEEEAERERYELCTYIAGVFDYFKPGITDIVNTPNYLFCRLAVNGEQLELKEDRIKDFKRILNLKDGTLIRSFVWESENGSRTKIESVRFLSMSDIHSAVLRYKIIPLNYSGSVLFETAIDARVANNPIHDDQMKKDINPVEFLQDIEKGMTDEAVGYITVRTSKTGYEICEAFSVTVHASGDNLKAEEGFVEDERYIGKRLEFQAVQGNEYIIDKIVGIFTSRDYVKDSIKNSAVSSVISATHSGFAGMYELHKKAWEDKWDIADIIIEGSEQDQLRTRYNVFQLIQGNAENDPKVSIGARGIMHGRYKGCYFWDTEIFMLPFFIYTNPKAARNLLMYRYHTLPGAEENARNQSVDGARYAWMCSIDGREQCETWDIGCSEVHITADVSYAVNNYWEVTGDEEFMRGYGAEILIKTARYWKSRFTYHAETDCYNMLFVKGPNEYGGVTLNNTYTTLIALHNFKLAINTVTRMKKKYRSDWNKLKEKTDLADSEMDLWKDIINKAVINYDKKMKLYIEDDNFMKTEPINLSEYKDDDTPLYHKISFDRLQRYRVLKQADIILLMTLMPQKFTDEEKLAAWNFYEPITLHDSTLSYGTHSLFASRLGLMNEAYKYFLKSASLDLDDIMNNTGREGIHFASLGATWQAVINGFGGVKVVGGKVCINPALPEKWNMLKFNVFYGGSLIKAAITKDTVKLSVEGNSGPLEIEVMGKKINIYKEKHIAIRKKS